MFSSTPTSSNNTSVEKVDWNKTTLAQIHEHLLEKHSLAETAKKFGAPSFQALVSLLKIIPYEGRGLTDSRLKRLSKAAAEKNLGNIYHKTLENIKNERLNPDNSNKYIPLKDMQLSQIITTICASSSKMDAARQLGKNINTLERYLQNALPGMNFTCDDIRRLQVDGCKKEFGDLFDQKFMPPRSTKRTETRQVQSKITGPTRHLSVQIKQHTLAEVHQAILENDYKENASKALMMSVITLNTFLKAIPPTAKTFKFWKKNMTKEMAVEIWGPLYYQSLKSVEKISASELKELQARYNTVMSIVNEDLTHYDTETVPENVVGLLEEEDLEEVSSFNESDPREEIIAEGNLNSDYTNTFSFSETFDASIQNQYNEKCISEADLSMWATLFSENQEEEKNPKRLKLDNGSDASSSNQLHRPDSPNR